MSMTQPEFARFVVRVKTQHASPKAMGSQLNESGASVRPLPRGSLGQATRGRNEGEKCLRAASDGTAETASIARADDRAC